MPKRYHYQRTVIQVEVLSEDSYDYVSIKQLAFDITEGSCSGEVKVVRVEPLSGKEVAEALTAQGSDPEFFQLDSKGNEIT